MMRKGWSDLEIFWELFFFSWTVKPDKGGMVASWVVCLTLDQAVWV